MWQIHVSVQVGIVKGWMLYNRCVGVYRVRGVKMPIHSSKRRASPVSSRLSSAGPSLGGQRGAGGHERIMGEQLTLIRSERHSGWPQDPRRAQPNHGSHWLWQMSAAQCPTPTQKSSHWSHREKNPPLDRFAAHVRFCFLHMAKPCPHLPTPSSPPIHLFLISGEHCYSKHPGLNLCQWSLHTETWGWVVLLLQLV